MARAGFSHGCLVGGAIPERPCRCRVGALSRRGGGQVASVAICEGRLVWKPHRMARCGQA